MSEWRQNLKQTFFALCVGAFFVNIGLLVFASTAMTGQQGFELEILSILNMILLSFVLIREPNQKKE